MEQSPPPILDGAQVLLFARVNERSEPTGACVHTRGDNLVPSAAGLAICRYPGDEHVYLFYCDAQWSVLTDTVHATLDAAQEQAEFEYRGSAQSWVAR